MGIQCDSDLLRLGVSAFTGGSSSSGTSAIKPLYVANSAKGAGSTVATASLGTTSSGSTLIAHVTWNPDSTPVITDTYGNTWTLVTTKISLVGYGGFQSVYAAQNVVGGAGHTVTSTVAGAGAQTLLVCEIGGAIASSLDLLGAGTDVTPPSFTVTTANNAQAYEMILALTSYVGDGVNNCVSTESTGYTSVIEEPSSALWQSSIFAKTVETVASHAPNLSVTNISDVGMVVLGLKGDDLAIRLGASTYLGQEDGNSSSPGVTPSITTRETGSSFVIFVAGYVSNFVTPVCSKGNTLLLRDSRIYDGYSGQFGLWMYTIEDGVGGANHTFSVTKAGQPSGELTVMVAEVMNAPSIVAAQLDYVRSAPYTSPSIDTDGPTVQIASWWGDAVGLNHSATPNNGFTNIQSFGTLPPGSAVQAFMAHRATPVDGTYSTTWTSTPTQNAILALVTFGGSTSAPSTLTMDEVADTSGRMAMTSAERAQLLALGASWSERRLIADETKTNDTSNQYWFASANLLPLQANSTYEFEGFLVSTNGATSHGLNVQFDAISGASILWESYGAKTALNSQGTAVRAGTSNTFNTNRNVTTASTATGNLVKVKGIIRTTTVGNLVPRVSQTAASGSFTILAGTHFRVRRVGANTMVNSGQWV